ncbi:hypothetical protein CK203_038325 [Vitis vinifera]|uniref:Protein kinase domain-containing protein n=1 Tax=Vitis vinifera TaxID=29760 RepID=A0A438HEH8_VITVI|nr:hypothetical protein CK203_038325 [Vitis vinifera]
MLTNGGLLLERRISYFDGRYSNPMRSFSADELQKATDSYNHENRIFGYTSHFRWPIIHRDIHPGHFYLDQDLRAKLSDFICSMALPEGKTQVENEVACGTLGYLGPEV